MFTPLKYREESVFVSPRGGLGGPPLDILTFTFYVWGCFLRRILIILQFFIFIFNLITCIRTISQSTDVQHITSLHQIAYLQRIRCIKNTP
jgi:hypothetical protein